MPTFNEIWDLIVTVFNYPVTISPGGGLQVSLKSLIVAILIFVVMYRISMTAQRLFQKKVVKHIPLDSGLSYTLQRLLHYVITVMGALFALNVGIGINFTSLAVVLTALSVGIGLGMQGIASDVAAGFVILFERPLRVGDRIKLSSSLEGDVQTIDIRTTKIRTNDNLIVIVPNSQLTSDAYVNWSYSNEPVRLHIPVGVAYGSDVAKVRDALLAASLDVDGVLQDPKPSVRLVSFGDSSLDFERAATWTSLVDTRRTFPHADRVGHCTIFNVRGNHYRLITHVDYRCQLVFLRHFLTHPEYDEGDWKNDC